MGHVKFTLPDTAGSKERGNTVRMGEMVLGQVRGSEAGSESTWDRRVNVHVFGGWGTSRGPGVMGSPGAWSHLGHLPPQVVQLALQRALLAESRAQRSLLGVEQSLQVLEAGLGGQQVSLLFGIAKEARENEFRGRSLCP